MTKTLYLLRHAKAENGTPAMSDAERPLAPRGHSDAQALADWLRGQAQAMAPQRLGCSPSLRTRETWQHVQPALPPSVVADFDEVLYLAGAGELLHYVQGWPEGIARGMVLAHNPGLHELALTLAASGDATAMRQLESGFPTCALAILACGIDRWGELAPQCARLEILRMPGQMAA